MHLRLRTKLPFYDNYATDLQIKSIDCFLYESTVVIDELPSC